MRRAIDETQRRRDKQKAFNILHGIEARSIIKAVKEMIDGVLVTPVVEMIDGYDIEKIDIRDEKAVSKALKSLEKRMLDHAKNLEFEQASGVRDALKALKNRLL
jgi:excinuclease ABC subunit B